MLTSSRPVSSNAARAVVMDDSSSLTPISASTRVPPSSLNLQPTDDAREALGLGSNSLRRQQQDAAQSSEDMLKEQDLVLGELESHLTVIGTQSDTIHNQVSEQLRDLNDLESGMEQGARNIDNVYYRTKNLVDKSGGPRPIFVIACLSLTAIVLLCLVIYT